MDFHKYYFWTQFRLLIQSGGGPEDLQCILASCPLLFKSSDDKRMKNDNLFSVIFYGNHNLERRRSYMYSSYPPRNTFSTLYDEVRSLRLWSFKNVLYIRFHDISVFIYRYSSYNYIHTLIMTAHQYYSNSQHYIFMLEIDNTKLWLWVDTWNNQSFCVLLLGTLIR